MILIAARYSTPVTTMAMLDRIRAVSLSEKTQSPTDAPPSGRRFAQVAMTAVSENRVFNIAAPTSSAVLRRLSAEILITKMAVASAK